MDHRGKVGTIQTVDSNLDLGFAGLDRFGRLTDLHHKLGATTLHRFEYTYDVMGNRTSAKVTQRPFNGQQHVNDRSSVYEYDGLHRLTNWTMGQLNSEGTIDPYGTGSAPYPRSIDWRLDTLGNWSADPEGSEIRTQDFFTSDPGPETLYRTHVVNQANQVTEKLARFDSNPTMGPDGAFTYDANGNTVFDGQYYLQYDAWNRLVQVNAIGSAAVGTDGHLSGGTLGALVCRYTYDGLGRLIRKETPVSQGLTALQIKDLYYDGVRRIQETIARPPIINQNSSMMNPEADPTGGAGTFQLEGIVENDEQPLEKIVEVGEAEPVQTIVEPQMLIGGGPGGGTERWTDRQYVYGPEYVDEFICQIDRYDDVWYMLQDGNYNVVAILTDTGNVVTQYTYEPYGLLVAVEHIPVGVIPPVNRVGHQGLFFERFDGQYTDLTISAANEGLYYNRNRFYSPVLGRFIQRDPNETGLPIIAALAINGEAATILLGGFNGMALYSNGMNLYAYEESNPVVGRDPLGLYDDFDDAISDITGQRLYAIGMLNEGARVASIGLNLAMDIALGLLPGAGIYDAFNSIQVIASGGGSFWDVMNIVSVAIPAAKFIGSLDSLRAISKSRKFRATHCNCFVGGTPVDTIEGPRSIESIEEGDLVLARDEEDACQAPRSGRVTRVFKSIAPAIIWLSFASGQVIGTTVDHEVWTDQDGWTSAGKLEIGDTFTDYRGNAIAVTGIRLDATPTIVYNLEVEGAHTYFVDGLWVHNNSCPAIRSLDRVHGGKLHTEIGTARAKALRAAGMKDVRWNQALVNAQGQRVSNLRPDIQYIGPDGKVHIQEIIVTSDPGPRRREDFVRLLGSDFGSYLAEYP